MMWKKLKSLKIVLLLLAVIPMQAYALDCSHKPPCPPGTSAQESVSCEACCPDGSFIKNATDTACCVAGYWLSPDGVSCLPDGAILKSDGSCYVMNEADPCCKEGWHQVDKYDCCPDGFTKATDNEWCCTQRADGKCCPPDFIFSDVAGTCIPPKPKGVVVR